MSAYGGDIIINYTNLYYISNIVEFRVVDYNITPIHL